MEIISVVIFSSNAISFVNSILVMFDIIYSGVEIDKHFSLTSSFTSLTLFFMLVSLKSWGRSSVVCTFVTVFLFLIVREEHSRPFAISFRLFASMLFVPQ